MPRVEGGEALDRILKAMPKDMATSKMRTALRKGSAPVAVAMKAYAPSGSTFGGRRHPELPTLKDSIIVRSRKDWVRGDIMSMIGPSRDVYYAPMVEYGHALVPRGRSMRWRGKGSRSEISYIYTVTHGQLLEFVPAQPFARPAWEMSRHAAFSGAAKSITETVNKWGRKQVR